MHRAKERNGPYAEKYFASHGKPFDISTGVDNLTVADIKQYENQWSKIVDRLRDPGNRA